MSPRLRSAILAILMLTASIAAVGMRPTRHTTENGPRINLEAMIPKEFGGWHLIDQGTSVVADPGTQALINKIYNQTLSRAYANSAGYRIMLSISYGGDQSDDLQVHRPEVCYAAQGFEIISEEVGQLATPWGQLPIKRVITTQGARKEPVTYWIVVGGKATPAGIRNKLARLTFGLRGTIPDGMLVRISSIDPDVQQGYLAHAAFANDMLAALNPSDRSSVAGSFNH
jgi:EpsI family protein